MEQDQSGIISITKAFWLRKAGVTLCDGGEAGCGDVSGFFRLLQQWHEKDQQSGLKGREHAAHSEVDFEGSSMSTKDISRRELKACSGSAE
jgi:hypothetical protein